MIADFAVRRAAIEAGVTIAVCGAFGPDRDVSHEEPERRRLGIDYLISCIDLAAAVRRKYLSEKRPEGHK